MADLICKVSNGSPSWELWDLFMWKAVPEKLGGGIPYIQNFKDAWVRHNKTQIQELAKKHSMPAELIAGVAWIEVGGDPTFIDSVAFEVRSFDWSGPDWVDRNMTITHRPSRTSFGNVSVQLRTAAETLGFDPNSMTNEQFRHLAECLKKDVFNLKVVALHLRQLIDHDSLQTSPPALTEGAIRVVGARYNRGIGLPLEKIRENTSYGDFIVKFWKRFQGLVK